MEKVNMKEVLVGAVYKFTPTARDKYYIARVKEHSTTFDRVNSSCYTTDAYKDCMKNGDFSYCIYTAEQINNDELLKFKRLEKKNGYEIERAYKKGDQVRYLGSNCAEGDIKCCFLDGEIVTVKHDTTHGTVTCVGLGGTPGAVEQTTRASQVEFVRGAEAESTLKFNVGDEVIGNSGANKYGQTVEGWIGIVTMVDANKIDCNSIGGGNTYSALDVDCFDIYTSISALRTVMPAEGWCLDANDDLGRYLALRSHSNWEPPGKKGYAWNNTSYWTIAGHSEKPIIAYENIKHLLKQHVGLDDNSEPLDEAFRPITDYPRKPSEINRRDRYYVGDTVRVVQLEHSAVVTEMKPQLGQLSVIKKINTDRSFQLADMWNYRIGDIELYCRGEDGVDADRAAAISGVPTVGTIPPTPPEGLTGFTSPPHVPKIFNDKEHVYLVGELESGLREYISYIGFVDRDTCDGYVTVTFIKENGNRVRGTVRQENLVRSTQNVTNSPKDNEAKKLALKDECYLNVTNFVQGRNVKVVLVVHGKPWKKGDVGVVVKVLEDHCRVRIFSGADKGTVYKIHKRYIDVTGERLTIRIPEDDTHTFYKQSATGDSFRYISGVDPINEDFYIDGVLQNGEGLIMRPLKLRKHLVGYGPAITNRVVEARHTPNKPDKWVNNPLVIEVDPVTDRTIKVRIK
jgi:hypothetical protein